jgi:hypothetical protein
MKKERKKGSGGARSSSGRPLKYGEQTVNYSKRVPKSLFAKISKIVDIEVNNFEILKIKKDDN